MKATSKTLKLFYKFLASYIIIFFIPLSISGVFINNRFIGILKDEIISNNAETLNRIKYIIDNQLIQLQNTANQIYLNKDLRPFSFNASPLSAITVKSVLSGYCASNRFIDDIFLYYHEDDYIYSSKSSYLLDNFCKEMYKYENWSEDEVKMTLNTIDKPSFRSSENIQVFFEKPEKYITMITPLVNDSGKSFGTVMILIKEKNMDNLLNTDLKDYNGYTYILDQTGQIIYTSNAHDELITPELLTSLNSDTGIQKTYTINNEEYYISKIKSPQTKWSYLTLVSSKSVMNKVSDLKKEYLYIVLFIFVLGSIVIYLLMNINYKPIKQLKKYAELFGINKPQSNEIEIIRGTLDFLSEQNTVLNEKSKINEEVSKNSLLNKLIKGEYHSFDEFNRELINSNIFLNKGQLTVATIYFKGKDINKQCVVTLLLSCSNDNVNIYYVDLMNPNSITFIIRADSIADNILENIAFKFEKQFTCTYVIGVSNSIESPQMLPEAYIEASYSVDYRFVKGTNKIIHYSEVNSSNHNSANYPYRDFEQLKIAIGKKDTAAIQELITSIITYIKKNNLPLYMAKGICFDLINHVTYLISSVSNDLLFSADVLPDVLSLSEIETSDELISAMTDICKDICNVSTLEEEKFSSELLGKVIHYINNNYCDCDFSIQKVADEFNLSLPNLSQIFKDNTGYTVIDYMTNLRMEKSKKLITDTSMSLKDIALQVGYYNLSSFIRRFKQIQGITPGDYRKLYKK